MTLVFSLVGTAAGQELSHLYQPYGFQLPMLKAGEYLVSASFNGWDDESTVHYIDNFSTPTIEFDEVRESNWQYASVSGVIGISDKFLTEVVLNVYPSITNNTISSFYPTEESVQTADNNTYLAPMLKLVFRPSTNLEFFGQFRTETRTITYDRTNAPSFWIDNVEDKHTDFAVGVSYFGKL
jgi:hypothetical protein